jgi:predicted dehydrogenase
MLKIVLAGLGVRGAHWAEVIRRSSNCEVTAYVDPNPTVVERIAAQYGRRPSFASVEAALAVLGDVDALVLATPPIGRAPQVAAAAARCLPMLIEKPLALSLREAVQLVALAGDLPLMVGLNFRYLDVTQAAIRLLRDQIVGAPRFARFTYERWRDGRRPDLNKYPLTIEQPMLWEQSIHHFDLLRFVYDAEPVKVTCQTWNPPWSMYAGHANVAALITLQTRDGAALLVNYQGTWQANWAQPHFEWRTECDDGVLIQRDQFGSLGWARRDDPQLTPVELPPHELWITETSRLLAAFVDTVAHGRPLMCSGRDHVMSLAMVEACALASQTGQSVTIADILSAVRP